MKPFSIKKAFPFLLSLILFLFTGLTGAETLAQAQPHDWTVSSAEAQGMNQATLDSMQQQITKDNYGLMDHVLVIRNGKLIFDQHFNNDYATIARKYDTTNFQYNYDHPDWHPYYKDTDLHTLQSCTKSITSLLVGIAIDEGLISGVDLRVMQLFEDHPAYLLPFTHKSSIR